MSDQDYPPGSGAPPPDAPPPEFGQPPGGQPPPGGAPPPPGGQPPYGGPADPYADPAWQQQQQQQGYGYAPPEPVPGLSIASLICGILSIPLFFCYGCPGLILGSLAVVFGLMTLGAIKRGEASERGKGLSIAGTICGAVGIVLSLVIFALLVVGIIASEL